MKKTIIIPLLLASLITPISSGADFFEGLIAYASGDSATALLEWTPLAEQGYADAQRNLGVMYSLGEGVKKNYVKAHMWANIARYSGSEKIKKLIELIVERMTQEQIAKAQDLAQECVAREYKGC